MTGGLVHLQKVMFKTGRVGRLCDTYFKTLLLSSSRYVLCAVYKMLGDVYVLCIRCWEMSMCCVQDAGRCLCAVYKMLETCLQREREGGTSLVRYSNVSFHKE